MKKGNFVLLLVWFFAMTATHSGAGNTQGISQQNPEYSQEEMELIQLIGEENFIKQGKACDAYDRLLTSFSSDPLTSGDDYPSFYGGAFIDEEGDLVVNVTNNDAEVLRLLTTCTGLPEIKTRIVPYSYAQLVKMSEELQDRLAESELKLLAKISGFGIDQERCLIRVYADQLTQEDEDAVRALAEDPDAITFIGSCGFITEETDVKAGSALNN